MSTVIGTGNNNSIDSSTGSFIEIDSGNSIPSSDSVINYKARSLNSSNVVNSKSRYHTMGGISIPHHGFSAAFQGYQNHTNMSNVQNKSPFLLPAQLYKSLFASAVLQKPEKSNTPPFPRNLLFSCADKSPNSDDNEDDEKKTKSPDEVRCSYTSPEFSSICLSHF